MSLLYHTEDAPQSVCWDRYNYSSFDDQLEKLKNSRTVYVGNLSYYTTELQIQETFQLVGAIKRVIMGLNKFTREPCGFCFVEYYSHDHAAAALKYISGTVCDGNIIRCDMDAGFIEGRQYGRGASGAQRRDENRQSYDPSRGGPAQRGYQDQSILSRIGGAKRDRNSVSQPPVEAAASDVDNVISSDSNAPPVAATEPTAEEERDNDIDEDDRHKSKRVRRTDE